MQTLFSKIEFSFLYFCGEIYPDVLLTDSAFLPPFTPKSNMLAFISLVAFLHVLNILFHICHNG